MPLAKGVARESVSPTVTVSSTTPFRTKRMRAWILLCFLLLPGPPQADEPTITVSVGNDTRSFTQGELLARPDATIIEVARDVTYGVRMTYRAVPVASLLAGMTLPPDSVIETVALDGFIAQLPPPTSCSIAMRARLSLALQSKLQATLGHQFRERT